MLSFTHSLASSLLYSYDVLMGQVKSGTDCSVIFLSLLVLVIFGNLFCLSQLNIQEINRL